MTSTHIPFCPLPLAERHLQAAATCSPEAQNAEVMKARRKATKSHFRSSRTRKSRVRVMEEANRKLCRTMDVDAASGITDSAIDIDPYNIQHSTVVDMVPIFAARTNPLNNNK